MVGNLQAFFRAPLPAEVQISNAFGGIVIAIYHLFTVCGDVSKKQMVTKNV
jgi:hypothetical protein